METPEPSLSKLLDGLDTTRPQVFKGCCQLRGPEIFAALRAHSLKYRRARLDAGDTDVRFPWYAHFDALPVDEDISIEGYAERLVREADGVPIFVSFHHLEQSSDYICLLGRRLADTFHDKTGLLPKSTHAVAFVSNTTTPFGVHTDVYHNFTFVVEGHKTLRTWPRHVLDPYFPNCGRRARPMSKAYPELKPPAQILEGSASDLLYIPENFWHVGESGGLPLTITLAFGITPGAPQLS